MTFPSYWEWKIIPTDVHSIIFQRGRSTTNQLGFELFMVDVYLKHLNVLDVLGDVQREIFLT